MIRRLFVEHPATVGETYLEHFRVAAWFGVTMILGGLAALVHAVVPGWCVKTGSNTICRLHDIMVINRRRKGLAVPPTPSCLDWVI